MNTDELARVDRQLREMCSQAGLRWVVSEVDELIRQGQHVPDPHESRQERAIVTTRRYPVRLERSKRPAVATLREIPFSVRERTLLLIDAMLAVFVELPAMEASAMETLRQGWRGRAPVVHSVVFASGDDGTASVSIGDTTAEAYEALVANLRTLRAEVVEQ